MHPRRITEACLPARMDVRPLDPARGNHGLLGRSRRTRAKVWLVRWLAAMSTISDDKQSVPHLEGFRS